MLLPVVLLHFYDLTFWWGVWQRPGLHRALLVGHGGAHAGLFAAGCWLAAAALAPGRHTPPAPGHHPAQHRQPARLHHAQILPCSGNDTHGQASPVTPCLSCPSWPPWACCCWAGCGGRRGGAAGAGANVLRCPLPVSPAGPRLRKRRACPTRAAAGIVWPQPGDAGLCGRADRLALLEVWLGRPARWCRCRSAPRAGTVYGGEIMLRQPGRALLPATPAYHPQARGQTFVPDPGRAMADSARPVTTRAVGGDRLGSAIRLNEYNRPGNLSCTPSAGRAARLLVARRPGRAVCRPSSGCACSRPPPASKAAFWRAVAVMLLLTVVLWCCPPGRQTWRRATGWAAVLLLRFWRAAWLRPAGCSGQRGRWPWRPDIPLALTLPNPPEPRHSLNNDLLLTLWIYAAPARRALCPYPIRAGGEDAGLWAELRVPATWR